MARMDSLYLQNLVNKSVSDFQDALNPLVKEQMQRQHQEWQDKRAGSQMADLYKANTADMLGDDFFNNAKEQRTLADNTRSFLNQQNQNFSSSINQPAQQKSVNDILSELETPSNVFNHQNSLADYIKEYNPLGAGDLIYGKGYQNKDNQGFNINPASSINDYYKSKYTDILDDKVNGRMNKAHENIKDTLKYSQNTQDNFWDSQYKMLQDLGVNFDDYAVNPIYAENGVEDFRQNPLTKEQNRYADLAAGGNTIAAEHIYNTMFPKMKLKERQYISPDGKSKVNEEIMYNISPNGRYSEEIINTTQSPYMSQKDLEDYRYNKQLGLIREKAKYSGSGNKKDDKYVFTPNQLEEKIINDYKITDPNLRNILHLSNKNGRADAVTVYAKYKPNLQEVKHNDGYIFGFGNNNKEYEKYNKDYQTNQAVIEYAIKNDGGADFLTNPLTEDEIKKSDSLRILLEPTDKLNIIKYTDSNIGFTDELPISKVKELINKQ